MPTTPRFQPISRRTVLRGAGAAIALPFLEAMMPIARAAQKKPFPVRLGVLFMANGVTPGKWEPVGEGREFKLSPILEPLARHQKDLQVLTNLGNKNSRGGDGHYAKTANWLTGTPIAKTTGKDIQCGVSMDQVFAQQRGHLTRFPSLELGIEPVMTGVDVNVNYTKLYGSYLSWRTPSLPVPSEINPRFVFDRLFRQTLEQRKAKASENASVLDLVMADAKSLRGRVGKADQQRLDEYLDSLRSIEQRIDAEIGRVASGENLDPATKEAIAKLDGRIGEAMAKAPKNAGSQLRLDHTEHVRLMLDLMAMAFRTDSTRMSTFMFGWAVSSKNFSFLDGVKSGHHEVSHHENKPEKLAQYERICRWHSEQAAYFLDQLKQMKEGEGSVLDHSLILFGSSMKDGNAHEPRNLPIVLAGRGGGVETGRHVVAPVDTPLCNLYQSMLQRAGVTDLEPFGDSTGALI